MAAVLKKRALAEFAQSKSEYDESFIHKKPKLGKKRWEPGSSSGSAFIGLLSTCKTSNEALQLLLRVSETSTIQPHDLPDSIRRLILHLPTEQESAVRANVLALLAHLGSLPSAGALEIIEDVMEWLNDEKSHKVLAQGLSTLLQLARLVPSSHAKILLKAKELLKDTGHMVKCRCLDILAELGGDIQNNAETAETIETVRRLCDSEDARVRSCALTTLVTLCERGAKLQPALYRQASAALKDDYELVRLAALQLISMFATKTDENEMVGEVSLRDDAFTQVCAMVTDLSIRVRVEAMSKLGQMSKVSTRLLHQTLDKKLMSNMRVKLSAHERSRVNISSGEWSTGSKWGDDAPGELLDAGSVSLISSGSCGALVHGLEDEYQEVRSAAIDSLCKLSVQHPEFAVQSLDFLVDMFNDEIEQVRLRAIASLTAISEHIVLREDQLETILGALKDFLIEVREGLHGVLSSCRLSTKDCLQMTVEKLLENLKKYPQDKRSTWRCVQALGARHPALVLPLVPELLAIHPFFDTPEPDVEDPLHITVLILIFNAAKNSPTMSALFEEHTIKHYRYLRDTMPAFVPCLRVSSKEQDISLPTQDDNTLSLFVIGVLHSVSIAPTQRVKLELMESAQRDLLRIADSNASLGGAPIFLSLFLQAQLLIKNILTHNFSPLAAYEPNTMYKLHQMTLKLQYSFTNVTPVQMAAVLQQKIKALSIRLVKVVKGNSSALPLCQHFLDAVECTQRYLITNGVPPETWIHSLFSQLLQLSDAKPGTVARVLLAMFPSLQPVPPPACHDFEIGSCSAVINEPCYDAEAVVKFTAGLVLGLPFDADINSLPNKQLLRIKVKYPDQTCALILPVNAHLRPVTNNASTHDYRLLTTVLLSHQVWTEACYVELSLVLDLSESEGVSQSIRSSIHSDIDPYIIEICKAVKVYVSPKPVKRGI